MTSASPGSDLAPETTSPSRQTLMAFGETGTTGWPASRRRSTSRPSGRSMATGTRLGSPRGPSRATNRSKPSLPCGMLNVARLRPA